MRQTGKKGIQDIVIGGMVFVLAIASAAAYFKSGIHREADSALFFKTYPELVGTRLDGCDVCHIRSMALPRGQENGTPVQMSVCDSCHMQTDYGRKPGNTLTAYGIDYLKLGRAAAALAAIEKLDSDGDGVSNGDEIAAAANPGDPQSVPGKKPSAHVVLSYDELIKMGVAVTEQTIFVNVARGGGSGGDRYIDVRGFPLIEVLKAAGLSENALSVDILAIDGFSATFSIDQLRRTYPQSAPVFGLGKEALGDCGWVGYEAKNLKEGVPLPDAGILLSFGEGGRSYEPARINSEGRLNGSGPFRIAAPQLRNPGVPDIAVNAAEECVLKVPEKHRFNRGYEKNGDYSVMAVVAIRVNPLPPGEIDVDWPQYAKNAIDEKSVVIFGAIRPVR
jgi:hypothetical protein